MIFLFNSITRIFDFILLPFRGIAPLFGLLVIALVTGVIMVTIFSKVSNQEKMGEVKNLIKAYFLELRIYKNDVYQTLASQKKILRCNLRYIKLAFVPATIMFIPILFILIQMNLRFGFRPFLPGETANIRLILKDQTTDPMLVRLNLPAKIRLAIPPLRIPDLKEVNWRIVTEETGEFSLEFIAGGKKTTHTLVVSKQMRRCYPTTTPPNFEDVFLNPGHPAYLPDDSPIHAIEINYPKRNLGLGLTWLPDWLVIFFAASIFSGLILKKVLKIH